MKCQTPQDLEKQRELYSERKSHNTFKSLVGISPNIWITFVSSLYGGCISDKEIIESSSKIDLLEEKDLIMADRGFSKENCFATMRITNVRIQVERAFRRIKGWHIFDGVISLRLWSCQSTLCSKLFAG